MALEKHSNGSTRCVLHNFYKINNFDGLIFEIGLVIFFCKFICLQWKVEYRGGVGGFMQIPADDEVFYPSYSDLVRRDLSHGKRRQREQVSYFDKH